MQTSTLSSSSRTRLAITGLVVLFGFALPLSIAATNLLLPLILVAALWQRKHLLAQFRQHRPYFLTGFALLVWVVISAFAFTHSGKATLIALNHYRELILVFLLTGLIAATGRPRLALQAFVIGTVLLAFVQWASLFYPKLANAIEAKRITNGFLLACGAYCAAWLAITTAPARHAVGSIAYSKYASMLWWLTAACIAGSCIFAAKGRTGYAVLAVLAMLFAWQFGKRNWRIPIIGVLCAAAVAAGSLSPAFQIRWKEQSSELANYESQQNIATSSGLRIEFAVNTWEMLKEHGILGIGHGNFEREYKQFARKKYLSDPRFKPLADIEYMYPAHPHNEFLYQWICGGIIGLMLFTVWLLMPAFSGTGNAGAGRSASIAITAAMFVGCLFNALLLNLPEAHAFVFLIAAALGLDAREN